MIRWETEIVCSFPTGYGSKMTKNLRKSNCAAAFRESPLKLFIRWYMTPVKIHSFIHSSFYPTTSPDCFRGCPIEGNYIHIFWSCKHLEPIWNAVISKLEKPLKKKNFPLTTNLPPLCLGSRCSSSR